MHFSQKIFLNQYIRNCFEFIVYLYYERYAFVHFVDVTIPVCCLRSVHRALLNCTLSDSDDLKSLLSSSPSADNFVWCKINNLPLVRLIILQPED